MPSLSQPSASGTGSFYYLLSCDSQKPLKPGFGPRPVVNVSERGLSCLFNDVAYPLHVVYIFNCFTLELYSPVEWISILNLNNNHINKTYGQIRVGG